MANITQTINSLNGGISQQPDEQKIPGQVNDLNNAIPHVIEGLVKRPAGKFVASLSDNASAALNSTANGKWFHYYRDETEQYIGQIAQDGVIKMWDCATGTSKTVVNAIGNTTYLTHTGDEDIQTLTLNDFTYINNRSITAEMDTTVEPLGNFEKEMFLELKSVAYARQYSLNIYDNSTTQTLTTATRIEVKRTVDSSNSCRLPTVDTNSDGTNDAYAETGSNRGSYPPSGTEPGTGAFNQMCDSIANFNDLDHTRRDSFCPNVDTRIFKVSHGGSIDSTDKNGVSSTYNVVPSSGSASDRKDLFFRIATTGQSVVENNSASTQYICRYTTTHDLLHGGSGWKVGDTVQVWMKNARYDITVKEVSTSTVQANLALIRPTPTSFDTKTTVTAESILGDIRSELIATSAFSSADVELIGNGLYIKRASTFNASTPVGQLLNVVAGKVNDVGDLPNQCKHGMVVEVVNSAAEEDNYYVKFFGNNDKDGEGIWEECAKPGRKIRFNYAKMPVALIRTADGNFRLTELDGSTYTISGTSYTVPKWDDCLVGDDVTNPEPSFIGKKINKLLFFRNRFAILADEHIILSRPGEFTNFWAKSAIQLIGSDPIDIASSSDYPAILYDGIQVNTGLVLFSKNQQFMLTTDSDAFTPLTAKINALCTYGFNFETNPISLGTTIGFLDNAGKFSRFYEMTRVQREGEPLIIEQSAVVSKLFESNLKLISNSRENSVLFFSEENQSTLYGYRYFDQINERKLSAWFKWTVTGTIQYHCMQDDALFVVVRNNNKDQLLKYSVKMDATTFTIVDELIHLDHAMQVSGWTYNASTNKSTKAKPVGLESSNQLAAYHIQTGESIGRFEKITVNGSNLEINGDWSNLTFVIGYLFDMEIKFPTLYKFEKDGEKIVHDTRSSTILHRIKLGFGALGMYETKLQRVGRVDYSEIHENKRVDGYQGNTAGIFNDQLLRTVPIYDRNTNVTLTVTSTHPAPATLHTLAWEGVISNRFYTSV